MSEVCGVAKRAAEELVRFWRPQCRAAWTWAVQGWACLCAALYNFVVRTLSEPFQGLDND
jgi:hypothetical protein